MFDLAWSEIALIGVVALIVIGPKDLPGAIRGVAQMVGKARRMAGEFQTHVDEMVREAKLDDVKREIDQFRNTVQNEVYKATQVDELKRDIVDPLKSTVADVERSFSDPSAAAPAAPAAPAAAPPEAAVAAAASSAPIAQVGEAAAAVAEHAGTEEATVAHVAPAAQAEVPPAFVPPGVTRS